MRWKLTLQGNIRNNSKTWRKQVVDKNQRSYSEESVPLALYDSGEMSSCKMNYNEFILKGEKSDKVFHIPTGTTTQASVKSKMHHNLRYPEIKLYMVPSLKHNSLMSVIKFVDANYITVLTPEEVVICNRNEVKL